MYHSINIRKMKQIVVSTNVPKHLMTVFNVSRMTVWRALNFKETKDPKGLYKKIRYHALQKGGRLVADNNFSFIHIGDEMINLFGSRVKIVVRTKKQTTTLYVDGKIRNEYGAVSIERFMEIQNEARQIAESI